MKMLIVVLLVFGFQAAHAEIEYAASGNDYFAVGVNSYNVESDSDVKSLFESMVTQTAEDGSFFLKSLRHTSLEGIKVLDVVCKIFKGAKSFGNCTLLVYDSRWSNRTSDQMSLVFENSAESNLISQHFIKPDSSGSIYKSRDGKLQITRSKVGIFSVTFR